MFDVSFDWNKNIAFKKTMLKYQIIDNINKSIKYRTQVQQYSTGRS